MRRSAAFLPVLALASGCEPPDPVPTANQAQPLPAEICAQVREGMEKLKGQGAALIDEDGAVLMEEQVWMAMPTGTRDQLVRLVGFHAACASPGGAIEREVTVRGESGQILTRRTVETSVDPSRLFGGEDGS